MKSFAQLFALLLSTLLLTCRPDHRAFAIIHTDLGNMEVLLPDAGGGPCRLFVDCVRQGFYDTMQVTRLRQDAFVEIKPIGGRATFPLVSNLPYRPTHAAIAFARTPGGVQPGFVLLPNGMPQSYRSCYAFGEIVKGLDVLDKIAAVPRDAQERPLDAIHVWVEMKE